MRLRVLTRAQESHSFDLSGNPKPDTCYEEGIKVGRVWSSAKAQVKEMRERQIEGAGPREYKELLAELEDDVRALRKLLEGVPRECDPDTKGRQTGLRELGEVLHFATIGELLSADDALNGVVK